VETVTEAGEKRKQQIIRFNLFGQYYGNSGLKRARGKTLLPVGDKYWIDPSQRVFGAI